MSNFFDSEIVQNELEEINTMQREIYHSIQVFSSLSNEDKIKHVEKLNILIEKQKTMYFRLSMSDDPEALKMKENVESSLQQMGFSANMNVNIFYDLLRDHMNQAIELLREGP